MTALPVAFLGSLAGPDLIVIGLVALLIFGRRLPEVGKNLGKTIVEFKKGLNHNALSDDEVVPEPQEEVRPVAKRTTSRLTAGPAGATGTGRVASKSLPQTEEV